MSYEATLRQINILTRKAEQLREKEVRAAVTKIRSEIVRLKITANDLGFTSLDSALIGAKAKIKASKTKRFGPVPVKYRSPQGKTWSGRGKMPVWMREALSRGGKKEDFLVG